ncbi:unnamed protein product [Cunninghamella blakesleeana]
MKYKRMKMAKMKNTDILSAGFKAYAKKRREKQEKVESIEFNFDKRKEFLTGFRKRKLERKEAAKKKHAERERQERIKLRAENKAERLKQVQTRMDEVNAAIKGIQGYDEDEEEETVFTDGENNDDDDSDDKQKGKNSQNVKEFKSEKALTTVTVIEDLNLDDSD